MNEKEMNEKIDEMRDSLIIAMKGFNLLSYWIIMIAIVTIFWRYAVYGMILGAIIILIYSHRIRKGIIQKREQESKEYEQKVNENEQTTN